MHVQFDGVLAKVATIRAKRDKDGIVTEEPAITVMVQVPVSRISAASLGALLRAMDRDMRVEIDDGQRGFDVVDRDGSRELVADAAR